MDKFVGPKNFCGYGRILWAWNFGYGKILLGMKFWTWGIFCCAWTWKNFLWLLWTCRNWKKKKKNLLVWKFWHGMRDSLFCWHVIFGMEWWAKFLYCRASRVKLVSKCWRAYGKHCLLTSGYHQWSGLWYFLWNFIKSRDSWIQGPPTTPCLVWVLLGHHVYFPFSRHWWGNVDTLWLFHHHWLEVGWWKNPCQWLHHSKGNQETSRHSAFQNEE